MITGTLQFNFPVLIWVLLLIMALVNGILACVLFRKGVQLVGANRSAILSLFEPIVSIAASALILKEAFSWATLAGCGGIVLGLAIVLGGGKSAIDDSQKYYR
jgi:drug/metabolite transporter (DMT)-like permease